MFASDRRRNAKPTFKCADFFGLFFSNYCFFFPTIFQSGELLQIIHSLYVMTDVFLWWICKNFSNRQKYTFQMWNHKCLGFTLDNVLYKPLGLIGEMNEGQNW